MTIDKLGDMTILVTLMRDDMERYSLDFTADGGDTRRGLTRLMYRVGEECGLNHADKSYLIEALPAGDSCLLIISIRTSKRRRRYRIKRQLRYDCCVFDDADALLDWLHTDAGVSGSIYAVGGRYHLLPGYPLPPRLRAQLSEYGTIREMTAVEAARLRENGTVVTEQGARRKPRSRQ